MFAVDSIPAIFAVTRDPFIVYTSNIFAILGLRSLFFVLAGVIAVLIAIGIAGSLLPKPAQPFRRAEGREHAVVDLRVARREAAERDDARRLVRDQARRHRAHRDHRRRFDRIAVDAGRDRRKRDRLDRVPLREPQRLAVARAEQDATRLPSRRATPGHGVNHVARRELVAAGDASPRRSGSRRSRGIRPEASDPPRGGSRHPPRRPRAATRSPRSRSHRPRAW